MDQNHDTELGTAKNTRLSRVQVTFGALAPPLREQPIGAFLTPTEKQIFQRLADALCLLRVHAIITGGESDKGLTRLGKRIAKAATRSKAHKRLPKIIKSPLPRTPSP